MKNPPGKGTVISITVLALSTCVWTASADDKPDPLLDLFVKKGFVTEAEAQRVKAEAEAQHVASLSNSWPPLIESKWKINKAIKDVELFGDIRMRYEQRQAKTPGDGKIELDRARYSIRLGLRGDVFDDFYYGLRVDTGANPRSPWVTFATSATGVPYYGPFGKSSSTLALGQLYLGWRPTPWADLAVGRLANPFFTTSMVWDPDLAPEGAVERFKGSVGAADFFATFGQFIYEDTNPNMASGGLGIGINPLAGKKSDNPFMLVWQAGVNYHFNTNTTGKIAATLYHYIGLTPNIPAFYGDPYVGEGSYLGPGSGTVDGSSGYNPGATATTPGFAAGFPNNQNGLNHLLVVEVPFEVNFKLSRFDARFFGDVAYNLEGRERAQDAAAAYATYQAINGGTLTPFAPQKDENKAYQLGFALGNEGSIGLVNGSATRRHGWEVRAYWQHVEQYSLDPNLLDSDFFEGRANLEGFYLAMAYGFGQNVTGTFRYGRANRINHALGTGGLNLDIPQINPIKDYDIYQFDLTLKF